MSKTNDSGRQWFRRRRVAGTPREPTSPDDGPLYESKRQPTTAVLRPADPVDGAPDVAGFCDIRWQAAAATVGASVGLSIVVFCANSGPATV